MVGDDRTWAGVVLLVGIVGIGIGVGVGVGVGMSIGR